MNKYSVGYMEAHRQPSKLNEFLGAMAMFIFLISLIFIGGII